jgi:hypothetical protein
MPVFPRDKRESVRAQIMLKKIERDDDSKKSYLALGTPVKDRRLHGFR